MTVADARTQELKKIIGESAVTVAVLANADGTELNIVQEGVPAAIPAEACYLGWQESLTLLAKLVEAEMKQRETSLDTQLKSGKEKAKAGDKDGAIAVLKPVAAENCLFPKKAKDASKELKKLGVEEVGSIPAAAPLRVAALACGAVPEHSAAMH